MTIIRLKSYFIINYFWCEGNYITLETIRNAVENPSNGYHTSLKYSNEKSTLPSKGLRILILC